MAQSQGHELTFTSDNLSNHIQTDNRNEINLAILVPPSSIQEYLDNLTRPEQSPHVPELVLDHGVAGFWDKAKNEADSFKALIDDSFFSSSHLGRNDNLTNLRGEFLQASICEHTPEELVLINSMYQMKYGKSLSQAIKDDNCLPNRTKDALAKELEDKMSKSKPLSDILIQHVI